MITDTALFRESLDKFIHSYPELFPDDISYGYHLHDLRQSTKQIDIQIRRIKLKKLDENDKGQVYSIQPSFVMPYMTAKTDDIEQALYLMKFAVPFYALTRIFGHNDAYWYRIAAQFGSYGIVQTTVQQPNSLPVDLLADEKHSKINGEKCYIATTVGDDCILGASIVMKADKSSLTEAYQSFKEEAVGLKPDYQPKTVNTDGWFATQNAWLSLFPLITVIECFLHAFISIRSRCKRKHKDSWDAIQDYVWNIYKTETTRDFLDQIQQFQVWANETVNGTALDAINKLCKKGALFAKWYDHQSAQRTSNMIDRHMEPMARWLTSRRYFHGHLSSAEKNIRSWVLLHNFLPYCPRAQASKQWQSPVAKLNAKVYHENWLHNLLVSTSSSPKFVVSHKIRQN